MILTGGELPASGLPNTAKQTKATSKHITPFVINNVMEQFYGSNKNIYNESILT